MSWWEFRGFWGILQRSQKVRKIRKVLHFKNEIEHKILVTYVIAKVSESNDVVNREGGVRPIGFLYLVLRKLIAWNMCRVVNL